jgi:RHS repeat-associated protein
MIIMHTFSSLRQAAIRFVLLACVLVAAASEGIASPGWQMAQLKNSALSRTKSGNQGSIFLPQFVIGTPSGPTTIYAPPSPTAITPELKALATGLDNDPVKIFNYVYNNIDFQPYFGSVKGAQTTYLDGAGNDMDQASLLIALLNQAGYPSTQYVYGAITVPQAALANWLQTTQPMSDWVIYFSGYPYYSGPASTSFPGTYSEFQHTWVEVTIDGHTYDLDPSYKQYPNYGCIDLIGASGYSHKQLLADAGSASNYAANSNFVQNMSRSKVEGDLGAYAKSLSSYIQSTYPNAEIEQIVGGGRISQQLINNLCQAAPPAGISPGIITTFSTLPVTYQDPDFTSPFSLHASFEVAIDSDIDETFYTDSLQSARLSLVFSGLNGQLWLGDTLVAQQTSGSGPTADLSLTPDTPNLVLLNEPNRLYNRSGSYNLSYVLFPSPSSGEVDESARQIQNYLASGLPDNSRQVLTETLHSLALQWARRCTLVDSMVARTQGVFFQLAAVCGRSAQETGYYVDMGGLTARVVDGSANANSPVGSVGLNAFNTSGFLESAFEHGVLEQDPVTNPQTTAFSTTKCLSLANDLGQQIFVINSNNYSSVIPQLTNYSASELAGINVDVNNDGDTLLVHQNGLVGGDPSQGQWVGNGYASFNNNTGIVGMFISGPWGSSTTSGGASLDPYTISGIDDLDNLLDVDGTDGLPVDAVSSLPPVTPKSLEPVDLLTGAYTMTHTDLTLGQQGSPMGLNFTRYYDGSRNFTGSPLGNGWRHSCQGSVTICSELDNAFGLTQPTDAVQTLVGVMAAGDFVNTTTFAPQDLLVATLAADWTVNQMTDNAANVEIGNQTMTYISEPGGAWNPPPGSTTALTGASGSFTLLPRFGGSIAFNAQNLIHTWTDVDGNAQTYTYDGSGNLHQVQDAFGRTLTFNYTQSGSAYLLQSVQDSAGRSVDFGYASATTTGANSPSNLVTITDPDSNGKVTTTLVYDNRNRLTDWQDANLNDITHNDYDLLDRVCQQLSQDDKTKTWSFHYAPGTTIQIDPQKDETFYWYDYKNRTIGVIDALGNTTLNNYDGQNHLVVTEDPTGKERAFYYDGNQNLTESTDNSYPADGINTTQYTYETAFPYRLTKVTDATNLSTHYCYYTDNHIKSVTDPGGRVTAYIYQSNGLLSKVTDNIGNTATTTYDTFGNPNKFTYAGPNGTIVATTSATYDTLGLGNLISSTDANNNETFYTYDNRRLMLTRVDPFGKTTKWAYDSNGNLLSLTDRNGNVTQYAYNNLGHLLSVQAPTDNVVQTPNGPTGLTQFSYDTRDLLTGVMDQLQNLTLYGYDADGRKTSVTNPLQVVVSQAKYDGAGRVTAQTDALGNTTNFGYDQVGRLQYSQDPLYSAQSPNQYSVDYTYDLAGRKLSLTNKDGNTFEFGYSATDGLPTTFTYPSTRYSQIKTRDPDGRPATTVSPSGNQTNLAYDAMGRVSAQSDGVGSISWTYDNNGNATNVAETPATPVSGTATNIQRSYDALNRVTSCTNALNDANYTVGYSYDPEGNLSQITYPGETKPVTYTYDGSNRLFQVKDWDGRVTTYTYDAAGRLQGVARPNNTQQTLTVDAAGRLTASAEQFLPSGTNVVTTFWQAKYGYDNDNHLTSFVPTPVEALPTQSAESITYNADNEVATFNGQNIGYDLDGNMLLAPMVTPAEPVGQGALLGALGWDKRNRLTGAGGVTYTYDAENRRISSTVNGQTTYYVWSRGSLDQLLAKINPDQSITRYIYGRGLLYEITTTAGGQEQSPIFYHFDWRGDTIALTDVNGSVIEQLSYSPYGACTVTPVTGTVNTPFQFNGKWGVMTEANGLLQMENRFYSPILQRFLNEDPSGFAGGANLYAFAGGDPADLMDPFGLGPVNDDSQGGLTLSETLSVGGSAALDGADKYVGGLFSGLWGAVTGTVNAIAHPIDTVNNLANGLGTLAGRTVYDTSGLASDIGNGIANTVADPSKLGHVVGSLLPLAAGGLGDVGSAADAFDGVGAAETGGEEMVTVYRGVNNESGAYADALNGAANPRGTILDAVAHNAGATSTSGYTSWTTDLNTAVDFADNGGVVMKITVPRSVLVASPDAFGESEVLIQGPVSGAKTTIILGPP